MFEVPTCQRIPTFPSALTCGKRTQRNDTTERGIRTTRWNVRQSRTTQLSDTTGRHDGTTRWIPERENDAENDAENGAR
jgi:hypothetical protein